MWLKPETIINMNVANIVRKMQKSPYNRIIPEPGYKNRLLWAGMNRGKNVNLQFYVDGELTAPHNAVFTFDPNDISLEVPPDSEIL